MSYEKITEADVVAIRHSRDRSADLAERHGVTQTQINRIRAGQTWKHVDPPRAMVPWQTNPWPTARERFEANYERGSDGECWEWLGGKDRHGYGQFRTEKKQHKTMAHRFSYEIHIGPIPDGMKVCHSCDNPSCVNPDHLWVGTQADNVRDMIAKGRDNGFARKGSAEHGPLDMYVAGAKIEESA